MYYNALEGGVQIQEGTRNETTRARVPDSKILLDGLVSTGLGIIGRPVPLQLLQHIKYSCALLLRGCWTRWFVEPLLGPTKSAAGVGTHCN